MILTKVNWIVFLFHPRGGMDPPWSWTKDEQKTKKDRRCPPSEEEEIRSPTITPRWGQTLLLSSVHRLI